MRGALKITYMNGDEEFFEVETSVGDNPHVVENLEAFLASKDVTIVLENEILIIPSTAIRQISLSRSGAALPERQLRAIPGVVLGARRLVA